jgi:outer membrane lipoprotein-sorting protein
LSAIQEPRGLHFRPRQAEAGRADLIALIWVVGLLACLMMAGAALGQDETQLRPAAEVVKRLKEAYAPHCCFEAKFDQVTVNVSMDLRDKFQGTMYVKRPGMIALDVTFPEKQKIVIRGRSYTVLFPEDGNTVQGEVPPELNVDHFFGFLANIGELDQNFLIDYAGRPMDAVEGLFLMEMKDRKNPTSGYQIVLGIDFERFIVRRAIISDALGNYNRFDLSDIRFVPVLPDAYFRIGAGEPQGKVDHPEGQAGNRGQQ